MSKVLECRTLIPVGVVLDMGDGKTMTVPTLYDRLADEVFVINRRDHDVREDVIAAVRKFCTPHSQHTSPVDSETWDQIRILTGMAKPPQEQ